MQNFIKFSMLKTSRENQIMHLDVTMFVNLDPLIKSYNFIMRSIEKQLDLQK